MSIYLTTQRKPITYKAVKMVEPHLEDVMELTDITQLEQKLNDVESEYDMFPDQLNKARLGIVYHETALNLSFLTSGHGEGYAKKSFEILDEMYKSDETFIELIPFVAAYRASALALISAETKSLGTVSDSFKLFEEAVSLYGNVCYSPLFLRASVSEKLPWFFFKKKRLAKQDFELIIKRHEINADFAPRKIMSFTYYGWAKLNPSKKDRPLALKYLEKAIQLDPSGKAARKRAEELKSAYATT